MKRILLQSLHFRNFITGQIAKGRVDCVLPVFPFCYDCCVGTETALLILTVVYMHASSCIGLAAAVW